MTRDQIWREFNRRMDNAGALNPDPASIASERRTAVAWHREQRADLRVGETQREQTAATILAALIAAGRSVQAQARDDLNPGIVNTTREAIGLADYLRAELAKGGGE